MMVSNITSDETHAKNVLKILPNKALNTTVWVISVTMMMKKLKKRLPTQTQIQSLIEINAQYGIQGGYQNHTGNYFGAPLWDLMEFSKVASPWISSSLIFITLTVKVTDLGR